MFGILNNVFGKPDRRSVLQEAIDRLSEPQSNHDEIAQGISALGERASESDIERLISLSNKKDIPDHFHEWIADALFSYASTSENVEKLNARLGSKTNAILKELHGGSE
jgi:hypothetical protein